MACGKKGDSVGDEIRATASGVETGSYDVVVESKGMTASNTPSLEVTASDPSVLDFDDGGGVVPCSNATTTLTWRVADASKVVVRDEDGSKVVERAYPATCGN